MIHLFLKKIWLTAYSTVYQIPDQNIEFEDITNISSVIYFVKIRQIKKTIALMSKKITNSPFVLIYTSFYKFAWCVLFWFIRRNLQFSGESSVKSSCSVLEVGGDQGLFKGVIVKYVPVEISSSKYILKTN